jgi:hypothetical protein
MILFFLAFGFLLALLSHFGFDSAFRLLTGNFFL